MNKTCKLGIKNPFYNKKHTEKSKDKIRKSRKLIVFNLSNKICEVCKKEFKPNVKHQKFCGSWKTKTGCSYIIRKIRSKNYIFSEKKIKKKKQNEKKWRKDNIKIVLEHNRKRILIKKNIIGNHSEKEWEDLKQKNDYRCSECLIREKELKIIWANTNFTKLTKDHIVPLNKQGTDYIENIRPLCISCNSKKRDKKFSIGYCCGVFDMTHIGHINLLQKADKLCDYLIVGIIKDQAVKELKGINRPIYNEIDREKIIRSFKMVDNTIFQENFDPTSTIEYLINRGLKISTLILGGDQTHINTESIEKFKLKKEIIERPKDGNSTSEIIKKIRE